MGWFSRSKQDSNVVQLVHSKGAVGEFQNRGNGVEYDPKLVPTLRSDHNELLALYGRIGQLFESKMYGEIAKHLVVFKTRLEGHLLTENFRFYSHLEEKLARDSENAEIMRSFRREMNGISRTVVGFIRSYQTSGVNEQNAKLFWAEYQKIGTALRERIDREEHHLYPIYNS